MGSFDKEILDGIKANDIMGTPKDALHQVELGKCRIGTIAVVELDGRVVPVRIVEHLGDKVRIEVLDHDR